MLLGETGKTDETESEQVEKTFREAKGIERNIND
jgi:hypothetical protein